MAHRAAIYIRISDDREGMGLGVDRQEQDCRALVDRQGWESAAVYRENDTSAFKRKRVQLPGGAVALRVIRPAFRQLLDDLAAGEVTALVGYDLDRVARDPRDLEDLIDVVEAHHVPTLSVTGSLDLSNDAGITMARVMVAVANKSSRDQSRRIRRKYVELAEAGQVGNGGHRPFGYAADRRTVVPEEAAVLRDLYDQVLAGRSLTTLCRELTERGVKTTTGGRWSVQGLRLNLLSGRNAGLREHRRQIVGAAVWPAIVDRETWERTRALLTRPGRATPPSDGTEWFNARKYLLTGFLFCGRCGHKLRPLRTSGSLRFGCPAKSAGGCGGILVRYDPALDHVVDLLLDRLLELDVADVVPHDPTRELLDEIAAAETRLQRLAEAFADDPDADPMELRVAGAGIRRQIAQARAGINRATAAGRVSRPREVRDAWLAGAYDLAQQRVVLGELIERIDVGPATVRGGPRFEPGRLAVVWR